MILIIAIVELTNVTSQIRTHISVTRLMKLIVIEYWHSRTD